MDTKIDWDTETTVEHIRNLLQNCGFMASFNGLGSHLRMMDKLWQNALPWIPKDMAKQIKHADLLNIATTKNRSWMGNTLQAPINWLVGGFTPLEKYESQLGWWHSQYMESHEIPWFQATNQVISYLAVHPNFPRRLVCNFVIPTEQSTCYYTRDPLAMRVHPFLAPTEGCSCSHKSITNHGWYRGYMPILEAIGYHHGYTQF